RYAAANPHEIDRLALVSPAGLKSDKASIPDFSGIALQDIPAMFVADTEWVAPFWPAEPSPEWQALRARESAAAYRSREDLAETDRILRAGLKGFDGPALLLWGADDRIVPLPFAEEWQKAIPQAELKVIAGGSHLLLDEFPAAVAAMRSFLEA